MTWSRILTWNVEFDDDAKKELRKLDRQAQQEILKYFRERISTEEDPRRYSHFKSLRDWAQSRK